MIIVQDLINPSKLSCTYLNKIANLLMVMLMAEKPVSLKYNF